MPDKRWLCSVCRSVFENEALASTCEKNHHKLETFRITGAWYGQQARTDHHGFSMILTHHRNTKRPPDFLTVKLSEEHGDYAQYKLEHHGPRGV